ncbi:carotenoid biosynthesis protein [Robiginitalea sp. SC105]|uniref:carotenoid biosynthesis protein n=1 Tax=Robiginitalea sp. SC105 TaxID=2762332 RepID=UPI0016396707|nr:carotenoid biosynthesis protein [Robiginitalea sp. SC105]MBC2840033.1 carotenoid biosynthesis protein [Robiginitalea sp. SC105]
MDNPLLTQNKRTLLAIGVVWLFHLSGLLGIFLGYGSWFIPKTPINLLVSGLLFAWVFPVRTGRSFWLFLGFAGTGLAAEWVGVHTGWLFGNYSYGENLGFKAYGVPLLIGLNWAVLGMLSGAIATRTTAYPTTRVLLGAALMTGLDVALEPVAPVFDFWAFDAGSAPLKNYLSWFALSTVFQMAYQASGIRGNFRFSLNLFLAQLLFFATLALREILMG